MKKGTSYFLVSGLVLLAVGGGVITLKYHSNHNHASTVSSQHHHAQKKLSKSTSSSTKTQNHVASKRADLLKTPTEKQVTEQLIKDGENLISTRQVSQQTSQFDFNALAQSDFSSLAGTWMDANGYTFEFSPQGIIDDKLILSALVYNENGEAISNVYTESGGGFILHYYAAGSQIPSWHFGITETDPSDYGRDRLFATQGSRFDYESTNQFVSNVFYKVSDQYSQNTQTESDTAELSDSQEESDDTLTTSSSDNQADETTESQTETAVTN